VAELVAAEARAERAGSTTEEAESAFDAIVRSSAATAAADGRGGPSVHDLLSEFTHFLAEIGKSERAAVDLDKDVDLPCAAPDQGEEACAEALLEMFEGPAADEVPDEACDELRGIFEGPAADAYAQELREIFEPSAAGDLVGGRSPPAAPQPVPPGWAHVPGDAEPSLVCDEGPILHAMPGAFADMEAPHDFVAELSCYEEI
jgi:hypothetical protein